MSASIVICDDSNVAREQIESILPADWDVIITHASNGIEGIEAIRTGKADFIFLALSMPDTTGIEVLKVIKDEDLPTIIIATDDGQLNHQQQLQGLGAIACIEKPVKIEILTAILNEYGVLDVLSDSAADNDECDEDLFDFCQEIANISMGRAAALLSKVIDSKCVLSVPKVTMTTSDALRSGLNVESNESEVSIVSQGFIGDGIAGEALLTFGSDDVALFAPLLKIDDELTDSVKKGLLLEITSILLGSFLTGIADLLDISFSQNHPKIVNVNGSEGRGAQVNYEQHHKVITIEFDYAFEDESVVCNQRVLFTENSITRLSEFAEIALA